MHAERLNAIHRISISCWPSHFWRLAGVKLETGEPAGAHLPVRWDKAPEVLRLGALSLVVRTGFRLDRIVIRRPSFLLLLLLLLLLDFANRRAGRGRRRHAGLFGGSEAIQFVRLLIQLRGIALKAVLVCRAGKALQPGAEPVWPDRASHSPSLASAPIDVPAWNRSISNARDRPFVSPFGRKFENFQVNQLA